MCDQIPSLECPECAYNLPDEHDIDDSYEYPNYFVDDPDYYRDQEIAWDMEMNA